MPIRPIVPVAPSDAIFTPNSDALLRSSSANFTRSKICFSMPPTPSCRLFTTVLPKPAESTATRSETSLFVTVPFNEMVSLELRTSIASAGKDSFTKRRRGSRLMSTFTL